MPTNLRETLAQRVREMPCNRASLASDPTCYSVGFQDAQDAAAKLIAESPELMEADKITADLAGCVNAWQARCENLTAELTTLRKENERIRIAAQAVIDRWDSPKWKDAEPTADVIARLRDAIDKATGEKP